MLTVYPESDLYQEIQNETWEEESELEKYRELRTLVENLNISTYFAAMGASHDNGRWAGQKERPHIMPLVFPKFQSLSFLSL